MTIPPRCWRNNVNPMWKPQLDPVVGPFSEKKTYEDATLPSRRKTQGFVILSAKNVFRTSMARPRRETTLAPLVLGLFTLVDWFHHHSLQQSRRLMVQKKHQTILPHWDAKPLKPCAVQPRLFCISDANLDLNNYDYINSTSANIYDSANDVFFT